MPREYEIAIFGATGYSGKLILEYLVNNCGGGYWTPASAMGEQLSERLRSNAIIKIENRLAG